MFNLGDRRVALVTDSTSDLPEDIMQQYDIRMVSLRIVFSDGDCRDRTELDSERLYEMLKKEVPHTSLPLPEDVTDCFRKLQQEGCTDIIYLSISSGLSGSFSMVQLISEDFPEMNIQAFDSRTLSSGIGLLVVDAAEQLQAGAAPEEILPRLTMLRKHQQGMFVIRTLEYLRKGGRIGMVEGVLGTLLQLKPVIQVNDDGVFQTLAKARGYNGALATLCDEAVKFYGHQKLRVGIMHANALEEAQKLEKRLREQLDIVSCMIVPVSPVMGIHGGPGLVGAVAIPAD